MQKLVPLNSKELRDLKQITKDVWGIDLKLDVLFLMNPNKEKVFVVNKDAADIDLSKLWIDTLGLYFGTWNEKGFRLSFDATQIIGPDAKKNVIDITEEQRDEWLKGNDVEVESDSREFLIVRCGNDYMGCGKMREGILYNFVPKTRRLRVVAD